MIWDVQQFSDALRRWTAFFGKHKKAEEIWGDRKSKTQVCKNAEVHLHIQGGQDVFADGAVSVGVSEYRIGWTWNCSGFLPWILCNWGLMEQDLLVECCGSLSFLYAGDAHVWTSSLLLLGEPDHTPSPLRRASWVSARRTLAGLIIYKILWIRWQSFAHIIIYAIECWYYMPLKSIKYIPLECSMESLQWAEWWLICHWAIVGIIPKGTAKNWIGKKTSPLYSSPVFL